MILVMGTVRFEAGEIERMGDAISAQIMATRAEDGCSHYAYARDVVDRDLIHVAERWRDNDALKAHFKTPHMAAFNAVLGTAKILSISVKAYDGGNVRTLIEK